MARSSRGRSCLGSFCFFSAANHRDHLTTLHGFFLANLILLLTSAGTSGQFFAGWRVAAILIGAGVVLVITLLNQGLLVENETSALATWDIRSIIRG